jgi:hypothetical protein
LDSDDDSIGDWCVHDFDFSGSDSIADAVNLAGACWLRIGRETSSLLNHRARLEAAATKAKQQSKMPR